MKGKRVGIIGTGATAIQVVPELAKVAGELFVFQRTPSSVDVRDQRATTPEEIEEWSRTPGWALARRARLSKITSGRLALQGHDDFLAGRVDDFKDHKIHNRKLTPEELIEKQLNTSFRIMEQIRGRVDAVVTDPTTALALKPYYPYGCKRPTFHDEYLPVFNEPHVTLVDTAPLGVREINEHGIVHDGVEYQLDVLIYATGFKWMGTSSFNMVKGRNGQTLTEKWRRHGTKTYLGIHSRGFPNLFIVSGPQGGGGQFNFIRVIDAHTDYVTWMMKTMRERGAGIVDVYAEPEETYAAHCREADIRTRPLRDCISYYNDEGNAEPGSLAYYGGPEKWHELRNAAQESLDAFIFEPAPMDS